MAVGAAMVFAAAAIVGGGVGGAVAAGGAVESVVGQSIQARVTSSKNAARRGQYSEEAWRRVGLWAITREINRELQCAVHSYGEVQEFFLRTPCRSLQRTLLVIGDSDGNIIVVSIAWVRMQNASRAIRLQQLVDTDGTGNVSPSEARSWSCAGSSSPASTTRPAEPARWS